MSVKNTHQTITSILEAFRTDFGKTAAEEAASAVEQPEDVGCGACETKEASAAEDEAAEEADASESLKKMAEDYIASHDEALKKEAAVFGALFADAFAARVSETGALDKTAEADESAAILNALFMDKVASVYDEAYLSTLSALVGAQEEELTEKLAAVVEEAYHTTLQKIGGAAEAVEAAAEAMQDVAAAARAVAEAAPAAEGESCPSDPSLVSPEAYQALIGMAADDPEAVLSEEELGGIQDEAYANVLAQLQQQEA